MTMQYIVVELPDLSEWIRRPAVTSRGEMYLIKDKKVVGKVRMGSGTYLGSTSIFEDVLIQPADDQTRLFFQDDPCMIEGHLYRVKYNGLNGEYIQNDDDESEEGLYPGTRVVDAFEFDFGICHASFSDVEGFDSYHKEQNKLRIHTTHKHRRRRKTYKIKDAA